jgi:hypothetical protein
MSILELGFSFGRNTNNPQRPMDVKLTVVSAKTGTKEIIVKRPRIIGRARGIGIVIPHPTVSDRHCLLFDNAGLLMVQDLNSATGTFVGGRKIIMAPLPPGAEFTVGPLTFRAEYPYSGSLESLPKILHDEPETEAAPHHDAETPTQREAEAPAEPNHATQEFPSFFGFGTSASFPAVAQPSPQPEAAFTPPLEPDDAKPHIAKSAPSVKKLPPSMPPPLRKVVETPKPEFVQGSTFGEFADNADTTSETSSEPFAELETGIPGLNVDASIPIPQPVHPEPPEKKKPAGSLLDYFSKRPQRRKRLPPLTPDSIGPLDDADLNQHPIEQVNQIPTVPNTTGSLISPLEHHPAPTEVVDDDLSNFFKKLE